MTKEDKIKIKNAIDSITDEQLNKTIEKLGPYDTVYSTFVKLLCDEQAFEYYANMLSNRMTELYKKLYEEDED